MRTYYAILGVPRDETPNGIRAAYRDRAKQLHPDHAGGGESRGFRELRHAYEVLSDERRRASYDAELEVGERAAPRTDPTRAPAPVEPLLRDRPRPEPLIPEPAHVLRDFQTVRPSVDALADRILHSFLDPLPKAERLEALTVRIEITPEQAATGVVVPLALPVFRPCPACGGTGSDWMFPCVACRQEGVVEEERVVRIRVPPRVRHGAVIELPLDDLGIRDLYLRLQVAIG